MPIPTQTHFSTHRHDRLAIGRVALGMLLIAGAGLSLLFIPVSAQQLLEPGQLVYHEDGFRRLSLALTPARLLGLRLCVGAATLLGLGGWLALRAPASGRIGAQLLRAGRRLRHRWQRLPGAVQAGALLLLALVLAARLYYLVAYPLSTDEIASFDYFVRQGPRVILSYYPIPNNHLLYNLLASPLRLTELPPLLVMRLPTWVLGSGSLALTLALLGRTAGFRRALIATALVGLAPLQVYYGAVGRGYGLQLGMIQLGFFAVLELLRPHSSYRQLAWAALILSSTTGLLLVPSYAYPLTALLLGLALGICRSRAWPALGSLVLAGAAIGLLTLLLYSAVGAVSGWEQLLANRYVASRTAAQFWPGFRPRLYEVAAELITPSVRLSGPLWLGAALLGGVLGGRLPAGARRRAALLAWLLLALPIGLLAAQRVFPLARGLLYVPWAGAVWVLLAMPRYRSTGRARQWATRLTLGGVLGLGLFRLCRNEPHLRGARRETQLVQQAYDWLRRAAPGPIPYSVGLQAPIHELFFAHYLLLAEPHPAFRLVSYRTRQPDRGFDFIIITNREATTDRRPPPPYVARYSDALVTIYSQPGPHPVPAP